MPLFKAFKGANASVSIATSKDAFTLGESVEGDLIVSSQEDLTAKEVRLELRGVERTREGEGGGETEATESLETRFYSPQNEYTQRGNTIEYPMHKERRRLTGELRIAPGASQRFPFRIDIPATLGPTFEGTRHDGAWLERAWVLEARVVLGGRPDLATEKDIRVLSKDVPGMVQAPPAPLTGGPVMFCQHCGKPISQGAVFCNFCGGRQASAEDAPDSE